VAVAAYAFVTVVLEVVLVGWLLVHVYRGDDVDVGHCVSYTLALGFIASAVK
jgi:hypothetical protein